MNERMVERSDEVGCYMHCISHMNVLRFIWHSLRIFHHSTYLFTHLRGCSCVAEGRTSVKLYFHDLGVESRDR